MTRLLFLTFALTFVVLHPAPASADPIALIANQALIDNLPFYSVGPEDKVGISRDFAVNRYDFIDIPYAIFDFGGTTSVSNAALTWNFGSLFGGSGPASITLYAGNDASGTITTGDRFMGTAVNTFTYSGGELRTYDVTSFVNASLLSSQYFAVRLEATVPPGSLSDYYGGEFLAPSLTATTGPVPEPSTLPLLGSGLVSVVLLRQLKKRV